MAPRPPETFTAFIARLDAALSAGQTVVRYGLHHHDHAVCVEDGVFRVGRLESTPEEAQAFMDQHGHFMPENAEDIAKPRTLVFESSGRAELDAFLREHWPI